MTGIYEYSNGNRLIDPHSYMYTKYEGREFFKKYFKSRDECIKSLSFSYNEKEVISKIKGLLDNFNDKNFLEDLNSKKELDSDKVLKEITYLIINSKEKEIDLYSILSVFCRKYEVSKRIYSTYKKIDNKFKSSDRKFNVLSRYSLLSFCLLYHYSFSGNLKFFNCAIKINDMLCSVINEIENGDQLTKTTSYLSFIMEKRLINELMKKKGI